AHTPESTRLMLLATFCEGGQLTKAKKMLQELKTLHVLGANDLAIEYHQTYRNALRMKDVEFIADIEDNALHSALLFYIAYAFTSRALVPGKYDSELNLDHDALDQGIELNAESLYFLAQNSSALRLVDTQVQILQYGMQRSERRWDGIANTMGQRFQYYEDHLRLEKSYKTLKERLTNLKLEHLVPELKISPVAASKMEGLITQAQRERLRQRVNAA
ncbi:MAG TPA: hypothetical protein VL359_03530, partial [bacterium]|nr:hypothetical protein [bacterium]